MSLEGLRALALTGGDWVIYVLLLCSVVALGIIIERAIVLLRELKQLDELRDRVLPRLGSDDLATVAKEAAKVSGLASRVLRAGLAQAKSGPAVAEEHMAAETLSERQELDSRLLILGTLGNNAPFVGLFGTVLGIIKAFHDLSANSGAGPEAVMQGLSEALFATAVGLFVAIPCVIAYNYFQKRVRDLVAGGESLNRLLLARLKTDA
ncbi:MAG: MotA/TolQ/ExbB proton channel family protein [Elusimicrobia bacterium]|nr:MotA/TolQ/ExbB proton channel family protein [Elusimicrobiota bacterium]